MDYMLWRGGLTSEWNLLNPILLDREYGLETDTGKIKRGDGITRWSSLLYETFGITIPDASETVKGIAEIATQAEVNAGVDDLRFITPLKLKVFLDATGYSVYNETPVGLLNGVNTVFTTAAAFVSGKTRLYLNGIRQKLSGDYTETGGNEVTFSSAPASTDSVLIDYETTTPIP